MAYMGWYTKRIVRCFENYGIKVAVKKTKTLYDCIKNNNTVEVPVLQKSGVYKLKCSECDMNYVGETGRKFERRLAEHAKGEGKW